MRRRVEQDLVAAGDEISDEIRARRARRIAQQETVSAVAAGERVVAARAIERIAAVRARKAIADAAAI